MTRAFQISSNDFGDYLQRLEQINTHCVATTRSLLVVTKAEMAGDDFTTVNVLWDSVAVPHWQVVRLGSAQCGAGSVRKDPEPTLFGR